MKVEADCFNHKRTNDYGVSILIGEFEQSNEQVRQELHNFLANKHLRNTPVLNGVAEALIKAIDLRKD